MTTVSRAVAMGAMVALGVLATSSAASAAGGGGASMCSYATGPTGAYDLGASIRAHQPFYGDNNPGFAGPGVSSFCQP